MATTTQVTTIGVKQVAEKLGTDPRELRKFIRSMDLGVGFGSRYAWASMADPQVKRIVKAWNEQAGQQAA
jgi:CO/xanthine dehydrogenase Mo-binding subunit